jgi:polysaccharide pyruvyl transferase WcaK-like protein
MKKIVSIGPALSGNKGAAAMIESAVQTLSKEYPKAQFTLLSCYPSEDKRINPYENLEVLNSSPLYLALIINPAALLYRVFPFLRKFISKKVPEIKALAEADVVLEQGGITFADGRIKYLIFNIATILPAIFMEKKIVKCAQALGPFETFINRTVAKIFLPMMELIVARGAKTADHLQELGLDNYVEGADYAFALEITDEIKKQMQDTEYPRFFKDDKKVVGISPSVVVKKKCDKSGIDYVKITANFINWLVEDKDYRVALIPHSVRLDTEKTHNNDLPLSKQIVNNINQKDREDVLFIDTDLDSQSLRYLIGKCDLYVASRFHSMVSSLTMGVPTGVIGWSHKYKEVLDMFGVKKYAISSVNLDNESIKSLFNKVEKDSAGIKKLLEKNYPEIKQLARKHVEWIGNIINLK